MIHAVTRRLALVGERLGEEVKIGSEKALRGPWEDGKGDTMKNIPAGVD